MNNYIIKVENLGKQYRILHNQGKPYTALRDVVARKAAAPFRWIVEQRTKRKMQSAKSPVALGDSKFKNGAGRSALSSALGAPPGGEDFWALRNVSFEVKQGEVMGIIGRNGAGKSTLLKILTRITEPTEGRARIRGRVASLLEVGTGFHLELTGRENIFVNGAILGMTRAEIAKKFDEIVAFAEIEKFLDTPVKRYSSGVYVRLAFAVAAHLESDILLVDEVLAVGDAEFQKKCLGKMSEVAEGGRTVVFVSHNMNAIEELCGRVLLLEHGKLVCESRRVGEIVRRYLFGSGTDGASAVWVNSDNSFQNSWFFPERMYLCDASGRPIAAVQRKVDHIFVQIDGVVKKANSSLCVGIAVFAENGSLLFWSDHNDQRERWWPQMGVGKRSIRVALPAKLLNEGTYRIELIASLHFQQWLCKPEANAPSIQLHIQGGLSESPFWRAKRPGLLGPTLEGHEV